MSVVERLSYRVPEAAQALGISKRTVGRLLSSGILQGRKIQGATIITKQEIERFLRELPETKVARRESAA